MSLELIKQLRDETGAGMLDIKEALVEAEGNSEHAKEILRKKGMNIAAKKQTRDATEGIIHAYIHPPGRIGTLIKLACETDFVARNDDFKSLAHELVKHIAAMSPEYISPGRVPAEKIDKEKEIQREILKNEGKSEDIIEKALDGKIQKFYERFCLLEQAWIGDDKKKIKDLIAEKTAQLGEKIEVKEFVRFEL